MGSVIDSIFVPAVGKIPTYLSIEMFDGDVCEYGLDVDLSDPLNQASYVGPCPSCYAKSKRHKHVGAETDLTADDMIAIPIERKDGVGKRGLRFFDVERGFDRVVERIAHTDLNNWHNGCFTGSIRNNAWRFK